MNNLEKIANVKSTIYPRQSSIGNGVIAYYSADNQTAVIRVQVNKDNTNLLLGESNVRPLISLIMNDNSKYINQEMTITSPLEGIIEYTLTDEQLTKIGKAKVIVTIERKGFEERVYVCDFEISILDSGIEELTPTEVVIQVGNVVALRKQLDQLQIDIQEAEGSLLTVINQGINDINDIKNNVLETYQNTLDSISLLKENVTNDFNGKILDIDTKIERTLQALTDNEAVTITDLNDAINDVKTDVNEILNESKAYTDNIINSKSEDIKNDSQVKADSAESNAKVYTDNLISRVDTDILNQSTTITDFIDITFKNGFSNLSDTIRGCVYRVIKHSPTLSEVEIFINAKGTFVPGRNVIGSVPINIVPKRTHSIGARGSDNEQLSLQIGTTGDIAVYVKNTTTYTDGRINYYI